MFALSPNRTKTISLRHGLRNKSVQGAWTKWACRKGAGVNRKGANYHCDPYAELPDENIAKARTQYEAALATFTSP